MTDKEIIESYKPLVSFIAEIYGENCEVLLHNLEDLNHSIVAIENNHITNREINGTITDFAFKIVKEPDEYKDVKYITNYKGKTKDGTKTLRSSTFFIRNEKEELIGMLCTNVDVTSLKNARNTLDSLLFLDDKECKEDEFVEEFNADIENFVELKLKKALDKYQIKPSRMTPDEKKQVVKKLYENEVFLIKGSIKEIAKKLNVSSQTIYRYLNEIKNE